MYYSAITVWNKFVVVVASHFYKGTLLLGNKRPGGPQCFRTDFQMQLLTVKMISQNRKSHLPQRRLRLYAIFNILSLW